jgi:quercetin dioxygenase-like cupin family protein
MKYVKSGTGVIVKNVDYSKEIIFTQDDLPGVGHLLQVVTIPPNTKQRIHFHDFQTEVFYCLYGECYIHINQEKFIAKHGDAFICAPGDTHYLWNKTDKEFKLAVFKINLPYSHDTHWSSKG